MSRFDQFYLTICKEVGGIEGFIQSFFDFMARKTDFFYEADPGDKMGFPPGYNRQLLLKIFNHFQEQQYKRTPQKTPEDYARKLEIYKANKTGKVEIKETGREGVKENKGKKDESMPQSQQLQSQSPPSSSLPLINTYNGGTNDRYSWSQQLREVQVTILIDNSLAAKQLVVELKSDSVNVKKRTGESILVGQLSERINASESVWKIEKSGGKSLLVLTLEKAQERIWSRVLKGDEEIDTSKVNNSKPLAEFDGETEGAIRKIMYEQQRKQMGLPTTQEEKQINALRNVWDAEGSPFKGQPFDPSRINMSGDFKPE